MIAMEGVVSDHGNILSNLHHYFTGVAIGVVVAIVIILLIAIVIVTGILFYYKLR